MVNLDRLSTSDLSVLCRKAGELCAHRFKQIAHASDPSDRPLRELLIQMAAEAERQPAPLRMDEYPFEGGSSPRLAPGEALNVIRDHLTCLSRGFGEEVLHRDIALFLAESLEEEAARFYRTLAEHATGWEGSSLLGDLSERERSKLRYLREVVLQG